MMFEVGENRGGHWRVLRRRKMRSLYGPGSTTPAV